MNLASKVAFSCISVNAHCPEGTCCNEKNSSNASAGITKILMRAMLPLKLQIPKVV